LSLRNTTIETPVQGGRVAVRLDDGTVTRLPAPDGVASSGRDEVLTVDPETGRRFRATSDGEIIAEKPRRRHPDRYKRLWRRRVPGRVLGAPVLVGKSVCYAALDDQVYCVRANNGHRLWAADIGERVSRPMAVWSAPVPAAGHHGKPDREGRFDVLLVVPDSGADLVALDAYNGQRLLSVAAGSGNGFASPPLVVGAERVAVTRQGYRDDDAALVILHFASPDARPGPDSESSVSYNPGSSQTPGDQGR